MNHNTATQARIFKEAHARGWVTTTSYSDLQDTPPRATIRRSRFGRNWAIYLEFSPTGQLTLAEFYEVLNEAGPEGSFRAYLDQRGPKDPNKASVVLGWLESGNTTLGMMSASN